MGTLILRRKFSANSFWEDIATHKYGTALWFQRHIVTRPNRVSVVVWLGRPCFST